MRVKEQQCGSRQDGRTIGPVVYLTPVNIEWQRDKQAKPIGAYRAESEAEFTRRGLIVDFLRVTQGRQ